MMESVLPDFLSSHSITIDIVQSDSQDLATNNDLIDFISKETNILIYRYYPISGGKAVFYSGNTDFNPELVSGRSFTVGDLAQHTPVAVVSETSLDNCIVENGETYVYHENVKYNVIGIFKFGQSIGQRNAAQYFVNITASPDALLEGTYFLDVKTESREVFDRLGAHLKRINPDIQIAAQTNTRSAARNLVKAINDSMLVSLIFVLAAFLVLLNAFSVTYYWIEGRFKEAAVRIMSGARIPQVRRMMLEDYLAIVTCSFGLGSIVSILVVKAGFFPFIGRTIHFFAFIAGYLICLFVGLFVGWIALTTRLKQNVVLQLRG